MRRRVFLAGTLCLLAAPPPGRAARAPSLTAVPWLDDDPPGDAAWLGELPHDENGESLWVPGLFEYRTKPAKDEPAPNRWWFHPDGYFVRNRPEPGGTVRHWLYRPELVAVEQDQGQLTTLSDTNGTKLTCTPEKLELTWIAPGPLGETLTTHHAELALAGETPDLAASWQAFCMAVGRERRDPTDEPTVLALLALRQRARAAEGAAPGPIAAFLARAIRTRIAAQFVARPTAPQFGGSGRSKESLPLVSDRLSQHRDAVAPALLTLGLALQGASPPTALGGKQLAWPLLLTACVLSDKPGMGTVPQHKLTFPEGTPEALATAVQELCDSLVSLGEAQRSTAPIADLLPTLPAEARPALAASLVALRRNTGLLLLAIAAAAERWESAAEKESVAETPLDSAETRTALRKRLAEVGLRDEELVAATESGFTETERTALRQRLGAPATVSTASGYRALLKETAAACRTHATDLLRLPTNPVLSA